MSFHDVFYHDVVHSYRLVVTNGIHNDNTCALCNQSCQWRCWSLWRRWTNVELFLAQCKTHMFLICAKSHLLCWWNIKAGSFVLRCCLYCVSSLVCGRFDGEELLFIKDVLERVMWMWVLCGPANGRVICNTLTELGHQKNGVVPSQVAESNVVKLAPVSHL